MPQLVTFGLQVPGVGSADRHLQRHPLSHAQAVRLEPHDLAGIVGEKPDRRQAQVGQDLGAGPVFPQVGGESQRLVGFDRICALVLQGVGPDFVEQADAAAFVFGKVDQDALALLFDAA